jgi:hypothetical protein
MSKQKEIVVFREVKVGEYVLRFWPSDNGWMCGITSEMMQALTEQSAQQALDKKAENARELGLDYEPARDSGIVTAGGADPRTQRTWVGLTDEEYINITDSVYHKGQGLVAYYKAIEAKLKEKNT